MLRKLNGQARERVVGQELRCRTQKRESQRLWLKAAVDTPNVDILVWRKMVAEWGQAEVRTLLGGRPNPRTRARQWVSAGQGPMPDELFQPLVIAQDSFHRVTSALETAVTTSAVVVQSGVQARTQDILRLATEGQEALSHLSAAVDSCQAWRTDVASASASAKKRSSWRLRQAMRPYATGGVPPALCQYLLQMGMLPRPLAIADEDEWPVLAQHNLDGSQVNPPTDKEDWERVLLWTLPAFSKESGSIC